MSGGSVDWVLLGGKHVGTSSSDHVVPEDLNRFRAHGLLAGQGYAEAFFWTNVAGLTRLIAASPFQLPLNL